MIFFIDGPQGVGKSTLLNSLKNEYLIKTFEFAKYYNDFKMDKSKEKLNGFQIGKDLAFLFCFKEFYLKSSILFDRGPISSLYYSLLENRMDSNEINLFLDVLESYKKEYCHIFINKINDKKNKIRNKNDGFDYLKKYENSEKEVFNFLKNELKKRNIKFYVFNNDFSKSLNENKIEFNNLLNRIKNEYN